MRSSPLGALDTLAATRDRDAARHLLDVIWPILVRRCRAELDSTTADSVATDPTSWHPGPLAVLPGPASLGRTSAEVLLDQHRALQTLRGDGLPHEQSPPPRRR